MVIGALLAVEAPTPAPFSLRPRPSRVTRPESPALPRGRYWCPCPPPPPASRFRACGSWSPVCKGGMPRASVPAGRTLDMAGAALTAGPALAQFLFPPDGLEVVVKWELLGELPAEQPGSLRAEVPWILGATDLLRLALSRPAFAELMSRPVPGPPETQAQGRWSGLVSAARRRSSWPIA